MQKVVCGVCGLANLESFPTYPHCAGCGARLPQRKRNPINDFFQRPIKTLVWAFCVGAGVATLALLSTGIARETRLRDRGSLLVTPTLKANPATNGADVILQMTVSTSLPEDREDIRNLRLRFSQKDVRAANIRVLSPPATVEDLGGGRYFQWSRFKPGQIIRVSLRPRQVVKFEIVANGFDRFERKIPPMQSAPPLDLSPYRSN